MRKLPYTYDVTVFDGPLTPEAEYFTGILLSDGSLSIASEHNARLSLGMTDRDVVEKFQKFMQTDQIIKTRQEEPRWTSNGRGKMYLSVRKPLHSIGLSCANLAARLVELGVHPRKSNDAKVCAEVAYSLPFWRAMVDGDGSIPTDKSKRWRSTPRITLYGTQDVCESFRNYGLFVGVERVSVLPNRRGKKLFCAWCEGDDAFLLIENLYGNAPEHLRLERKYQKAMSLFRE